MKPELTLPERRDFWRFFCEVDRRAIAENRDVRANADLIENGGRWCLVIEDAFDPKETWTLSRHSKADAIQAREEIKKFVAGLRKFFPPKQS